MGGTDGKGDQAFRAALVPAAAPGDDGAMGLEMPAKPNRAPPNLTTESQSARSGHRKTRAMAVERTSGAPGPCSESYMSAASNAASAAPADLNLRELVIGDTLHRQTCSTWTRSEYDPSVSIG